MLWLPARCRSPSPTCRLKPVFQLTIMGQLNEQRFTPRRALSGPVWHGLLLLVAVPGWFRAVRASNRDRDCVHAAGSPPRRRGLYAFPVHGVGYGRLIIPLVWRVRALRGLLVLQGPRPWRAPALDSPDHVFMVPERLNLGSLSSASLCGTGRGRGHGLFLKADYWDALRLPDDHGDTAGSKLLASPTVKPVIPAYTGRRVVPATSSRPCATKRLTRVEDYSARGAVARQRARDHAVPRGYILCGAPGRDFIARKRTVRTPIGRVFLQIPSRVQQKVGQVSVTIYELG